MPKEIRLGTDNSFALPRSSGLIRILLYTLRVKAFMMLYDVSE